MIKYFPLFCFLLSSAINLRAQHIVPNKTEEVDSVLTMVSVELSNVNPVAALELATEALSRSREIHYSKGKAKSCFFIGQVMVYVGNYDKSMEYLSLSGQEKYTSGDFILLSEISRIKGQVYFYLGLKNAAFREFEKAYGYVVQIRDKDERERFTSLAYENLGIAYNVLKNNADSSFYYLTKNKKLLERTEEPRTLKNKVNLYTLFGEYYKNRQQYDSAVYYFNKALLLTSTYNYPYTSWLYAHWGDLHTQRGDTDSALVYYRKGLENLGVTKLRNELPELYRKISEAYSKKEMEDSAKFYREKYLLINAELAGSKNEATEKAMQILLEEEQKYAQKRQQDILLFAGFLALIFFSATFFLWHRWKKRKTIILEAKEEEVTELKQKLNESFDEVVELAKKNDTAFLPRFREVYPEFTNNLLKKHPGLIHSELQLCAMIFLNFSSKDMAQYMFITHRSVQTRKSRLRKKLGIASKIDLYQYIKSFS